LCHVIRHGQAVWQHIAWHGIAYRFQQVFIVCLPFLSVSHSKPLTAQLQRESGCGGVDQIPITQRMQMRIQIRDDDPNAVLGLALPWSSLGLWIPKQSEEDKITGILVGQGRKDPLTKDVIVTCNKSKDG
jgi:hypothetical protein